MAKDFPLHTLHLFSSGLSAETIDFRLTVGSGITPDRHLSVFADSRDSLTAGMEFHHASKMAVMKEGRYSNEYRPSV